MADDVEIEEIDPFLGEEEMVEIDPQDASEGELSETNEPSAANPTTKKDVPFAEGDLGYTLLKEFLVEEFKLKLEANPKPTEPVTAQKEQLIESNDEDFNY
ncbi:hypothetical protein PtA15_11A20 [Puccinia triticina]|uniref:Uncharacterized protein n=1 Tax=Puccinia triticina TaxID=208348 RepID=A0ABY7CVK7_9BASI|nr:uncharacterized protein PtA15_11A20 [Puccinia triticina]WAQ89333.1 hypothetical protein PtA15_11A20 [Puccinia triticina]WAR59382.1 hypothetical protein PtB15_11B22 [Puccinia triticina]